MTTLEDLVAEVRTAKQANDSAALAFKEAQKASDAAYDRLAKANRAVGEYIDQLVPAPAKPLRMVR